MILNFTDGAVLNTTPNFNGHIVIIEDSNPNTSGFTVYNKGVAIFDATNYTTLYDSNDQMYMLSDDGSVKPEPPAPPEPPIPTYTDVTLSSEDESLDTSVIDLAKDGDVSFYISRDVDSEFLSSLTEIEFGDEVIDLTDGYAFQTCEESQAYELDTYYVVYHKFTEQELVNQQVLQNTANIDFIAMETDIEL